VCANADLLPLAFPASRKDRMQRSVAESQLVFVILLITVITFATLARRVGQPYLVLAGLLVIWTQPECGTRG